MAGSTFMDYFTNAMLGKFQNPNTSSVSSFDPDQVYGANLMNRSNLINPSPTRDIKNSMIGSTAAANPSMNLFTNLMGGAQKTASASGAITDPSKTSSSMTLSDLFGGTSDWQDKLGSSLGTPALNAGASTLGRLIGGQLGNNLVGAGVSGANAATQGFENPMADLKAMTSLYNLFKGLF